MIHLDQRLLVDSESKCQSGARQCPKKFAKTITSPVIHQRIHRASPYIISTHAKRWPADNMPQTFESLSLKLFESRSKSVRTAGPGNPLTLLTSEMISCRNLNGGFFSKGSVNFGWPKNHQNQREEQAKYRPGLNAAGFEMPPFE